MKLIYNIQKMKSSIAGLTIVIIASLGIFLQSCSQDDGSSINLSNVSIKQEAEEFGKQLANNLRYVVTQMNKNGDDFNDLAKIKTAVSKYYPQNSLNKPIEIEDFDNIGQGTYHFTPVQLFFLKKIREAQTKSCTVDEYLVNLKEIITEIQETVPEIQQQNLLKTTMAIYYLTKEMTLLQKEGLMPVNLKNPQYIRLRSGNETDNFWAALWLGTCVVVTDVGEAVFAALEGIASAAGYAVIIVGACLLFTSDTPQPKPENCQERFVSCTSSIPDGCSICLQFCLAQGYWPPYSTHKCN